MEKNKKKSVKMTRKCSCCKSDMKYRGPKDTVGTTYWKCRNKKCGRTENIKCEIPKTVVPLCYTDIMNYRPKQNTEFFKQTFVEEQNYKHINIVDEEDSRKA